MAFNENLNASIYMFSFFRSHVSDVFHAGFFQGYAWCSLCRCSCRLTTRMGSLEMSPSPHQQQHLVFCVFFFFGVNLDYLDFSGSIFDL